MPKIHIENTKSGFNRPRGFLISNCQGTIIENCTFYNMSNAIDMSGDANSWFESGPCDNVVIRNNDFSNAAYCGGPVITSDPQIKNHGIPYHKNIVVENNLFSENNKRYMRLRDVANVTFRNNRFVKTKETPFPNFGETGIQRDFSENVVIE